MPTDGHAPHTRLDTHMSTIAETAVYQALQVAEHALLNYPTCGEDDPCTSCAGMYAHDYAMSDAMSDYEEGALTMREEEILLAEWRKSSHARTGECAAQLHALDEACETCEAREHARLMAWGGMGATAPATTGPWA